MTENAMITIAVHNGKKVARQHNLRNRRITDKENHIDSSKPHETWFDEKPKDAYEHLFGDALRDYNNLQKRNDRKIKDYYNHIRKSGNEESPVYEMIVGVYKSKYVDEETRVALSLTDNERERNKVILKKFYNEFKKNNKNLYVCGCYYHEDEEGTPHIHIDYIPYAHYDKGLRLRNSMSGAIREMDKEQRLLNRHWKDTHEPINPIQCWNYRQRQLLDRLCKEHGLSVSYPTKTNKKKSKHLSKSEYVANEMIKLAKIKSSNKSIISKQQEIYNSNQKYIEEQEKTIKDNLGTMNRYVFEKEISRANQHITYTKKVKEEQDTKELKEEDELSL